MPKESDNPISGEKDTSNPPSLVTDANTSPHKLLRTPLFNLSLNLKAKFTDFSGWEMPVQYGGIKQEHESVRTAVGMFDISHMGKFIVTGEKVLRGLQELVPSNLEQLKPGQAQYTVLLNPQGGIIDDIIVYAQEEHKAVLIVNAGTTEKDRQWLISKLTNTKITLTDISQEKVLIALQGAKTEQVLQDFIPRDISGVKPFEHLETKIFNQPAFLARTGYTGEDGFEIMVDADTGQQLWQELFCKGVTPCGLGARDTLRLEAALALYGQDIDEQTTPLEAGLGWLVHLKNKGNFIGRQVLEKQKAQGVSRRLVGIQMSERYIARHGYPILVDGQVVGEVTSGTLSPTLGKAIALAYVPTALSQVGQSLNVEIRGKTHPAKVVKKPFYRSSPR